MTPAPRLPFTSLPSSVYGQTLCLAFRLTGSSAHLQVAFRRSSHTSRWLAAGTGKELAESGSASGSEGVSLSTEKPSVSAPRKGSGVGFGQVGSSGSKPISSKGPKENKRAASSKGVKEDKKSATVRRVAPVEPVITSQMDPKAQQIETAFILSLAFLGVVILAEGLLLAATGFLPEVWDDFFVTYLYPSFTPTVGVFLMGAVGYGLYKTLGVGSKRN